MASGYLGEKRFRQIESMLRQMCQRRGYDLDTAFKGLLDYLIGLLDPDGKPVEGWRFDKEDNQTFHDMAVAYFEMMSNELQHAEWYDAFGDLFMALHPKGGDRGQFFTPEHVCNMCANVIITKESMEGAEGTRTTFGKRYVISDPTCGSSRMLLAGAGAFRRLQRDELGYDEIQCASRRPFLSGEDLDFNCVKMSAINMAVHGCFGEVVCHDSLAEPEAVRLGYIINETQWPFPTPIPSIRRVDDPMRFVCTTRWMMRRKAEEQKEEPKKEQKGNTAESAPKEIKQQESKRPADQKMSADSYHSGEDAKAPGQKEQKQPVQLSLW